MVTRASDDLDLVLRVAKAIHNEAQESYSGFIPEWSDLEQRHRDGYIQRAVEALDDA